MITDQQQPTPEQMSKEQTVETSRREETPEELRARIDEEKKQLQLEAEGILMQGQNWSKQLKGPEVNPAGTQVKLDTLGREAQATVQEANTQLDQLVTEGQSTTQNSPDNYPDVNWDDQSGKIDEGDQYQASKKEGPSGAYADKDETVNPDVNWDDQSGKIDEGDRYQAEKNEARDDEVKLGNDRIRMWHNVSDGGESYSLGDEVTYTDPYNQTQRQARIVCFEKKLTDGSNWEYKAGIQFLDDNNLKPLATKSDFYREQPSMVWNLDKLQKINKENPLQSEPTLQQEAAVNPDVSWGNADSSSQGTTKLPGIKSRENSLAPGNNQPETSIDTQNNQGQLASDQKARIPEPKLDVKTQDVVTGSRSTNEAVGDGQGRADSSDKETKQPEASRENQQQPKQAEKGELGPDLKDLASKIDQWIVRSAKEVDQSEAASTKERVIFKTNGAKLITDAFASLYGDRTEAFYSRIGELVKVYSQKFDGSVKGQDGGYGAVQASLSKEEKVAIDQSIQTEEKRRVTFAKKFGIDGPGMMSSGRNFMDDFVYTLSGKGNPSRME